MIDMARWLWGDIAKVNAHLAIFSNLPGSGDQPLNPANDSAIVCLEFKNGTQGDRLFIDAILKNKPLFPSFYEGLKVQEVIDAAVDSYKNRS